MDASFCALADATFGPQIIPSCRSFDFTRLFEESFFSIAPSAIFLLLASFRASRILPKPSIIRRGRLHGFKLVAIVLLAAAEIAQLVLESYSLYVNTPATVPANVLAMVVTLLMLLLSHLEHCKALRPSSIICTYLSFSLLLGIPRARTLWMSNQWQAAAITFQVSMAIKILVLLLESQKKVRLLQKKDRQLSPEETSNVFSLRLFWWLNKLFRKGYKKALMQPDLYDLDEELSSNKLGIQLEEVWAGRSKSASRYSLVFSLCRSLSWALAAPILPRLLLTGFTFTQPFLVQAVTTFVQASKQAAPDNWGYGLIGAYFFAYGGIALSNGWYWHMQYRLITMVRGSLVSIIYSKTLRLGAGAATKSEATTLMSADVERIVVGLRSLHELWGCALDLGIALWLLYRQVGLAMLSLAGMALVCTLGASKTAQYATSRQKRWMELMQNRIAETIKVLGSLKSIKMLGFEDKLYMLVQNLRQLEINAMIHFRVASTTVITLAHVSLFMNSVLVFSAFLPIANRDHLLYDSQRVFNTLTLVSLISEPLQSFLQALPQLAMAVGCLNRIQAYLLTADHYDPRHYFDNGSTSPTTSSVDSQFQTEAKPPVNAFVVRNGHFGWVEGSDAVLRNVNVSVPTGRLTLLVGPVGCGKSTLLHALLGETVQVKGEVRCLRQAIAFCAQQPWLTNTTARKSIIAHSEEDPAWYERVVEACALNRDFAELEMGDQTSIGSGGAALSGGQKQRIALARAIYARRPVVLLDDVFSGLDRPTERFIFNALFGPDGIFHTALPDTTVVVATHAVRHLQSADHIIALLPNGDGSDQGTLAELSSRDHILQDPRVAGLMEEEDQNKESDKSKLGKKSEADGDSKGGISPEERHILSDKNVVRFYMKSMGFWNVVAFLAMGVVTVGLWKSSEYWARVWAQYSEANPANQRASYYLGIYALMNGIAVIAAGVWFGHWLLIVVPKTGLALHERILGTVLNATYPFLSRADTGGLVTRFGQDLLVVDTELPNAFANSIFLLFILIAQLALVASASVYLLIAFPVLAIAIYAVQRVYLRTSRRIRHLDLETKAPLYAQFADALKGASSIRAFNWQESSKAENDTLLNENQQPFYILFCVQRWLECVLDYIVAGLAVVVMGIAVATRSKVGGAQLGVALLNLVSLGETVKSLVQYWTMMETSIAAVSRIRNFVDSTPQETGPSSGSSRIEPVIDVNGGMAITLTNVSASYSVDGPKVLSNFSLDIAPGEKVAVCGRSGSGKSSLLNVLLRMMDITGELLIGHQLSVSFSNQELRRKINTIPQDPYFFPGTIRKNIDPDSTSSDAAIQASITKVGLDDEIAKVGGLDSDLLPETFSAGQLQLLSFARAILNPKGLLLLDEATSSVDHETDRKMHDIIFNDFAAQTVIAILHRREELHYFDRVVVIDGGKIVSAAKPDAAVLKT